MFITPALAQTAEGGAPNAFVSFAPFILILLIFYFLMIRPQQKRLKEHRAKLAAVQRGDTVITGGGLIGKVVRVQDDEVQVELADGLKVRAVKSMLADVRGKGEPLPANEK